uniref:Uncharacterized protein n=1 Tax=Sinocyclocheilus rhinocerous TaxID=307959 RepID=A0A673KGK2_9TELE
MLRTHSSSLAMSVSSSQGLTSNRMEDLAISAGSAILSKHAIPSATKLTSSSSEPNRSMSSSSSSAAAGAAAVVSSTPAGPY